MDYELRKKLIVKQKMEDGNPKKRKHEGTEDPTSEPVVCILNSEKERQCLLLLIEIYKNSFSGASTLDILSQILTKHGCNLFVACDGSTKKQEIIKRIIKEVLKEKTEEESDTDEEDEIANEVEKILKEDSSLSTLQQKIQKSNNEIFCKSYGGVTESNKFGIENGLSIIEMLSRFLIMLNEESVLGKDTIEEEWNEEKVENKSSPRTPSHKENEIQSPLITLQEEISLTQPFLQFFDLFTKGNDTECIHQLPITNVILHHFLRNRNSNNFQFGTNESLTKNNKQLLKALRESDIPVLSKKTRLHADSHIKVKVMAGNIAIDHMLLFMEHQRKDCDSVYSHKDMSRMCLCMRSATKQTLLELRKIQAIDHKTKIMSYGILSSRNKAFIIEICATFIVPQEDHDEGFIRYTLSTDRSYLLSKGGDRQRFDKHVSMIFRYGAILKFELEDKKYGLISTPMVSKYIVTGDNITMGIEDILKLVGECTMNDMKNIAEENNWKLILFHIIETLTDLGEATKDRSIYFFNKSFNKSLQLERSVKTNLISVLAQQGGFLVSIHFTEKISKVHFPTNLQHPKDYTGDKKDEQDRDQQTRLNQGGKGRSSGVNISKITNSSKEVSEILESCNAPIPKETQKITSEHKIGLYYYSHAHGCDSFVKINFYFDQNNSENLKVMETLQQAPKDSTLCHISYFQKLTIPYSTALDLFQEDIGFDYTEYVDIFITISESLEQWGELFNNHHVQSLIKKSNSNLPLLTKLGLLIKMMIDGLDSVKQLHRMDIVHCDISLLNFGLRINKTIGSHNELMTKISQYTKIPPFQMVLLDFNHSKLEHQTRYSNEIMFNDFREDLFYPYSTLPYCPSEKSLHFTKAHDMYSLGIVYGQIFSIIMKISTFEEEMRVDESSNFYQKILDGIERMEQRCVNEKCLPILQSVINIIKQLLVDPWKAIHSTNDEYFQISLIELVKKITNQLEVSRLKL